MRGMPTAAVLGGVVAGAACVAASAGSVEADCLARRDFVVEFFFDEFITPPGDEPDPQLQPFGLQGDGGGFFEAPMAAGSVLYHADDQRIVDLDLLIEFDGQAFFLDDSDDDAFDDAPRFLFADFFTDELGFDFGVPEGVPFPDASNGPNFVEVAGTQFLLTTADARYAGSLVFFDEVLLECEGPEPEIVPTPTAALAGSALMGVLALRRKRDNA